MEDDTEDKPNYHQRGKQPHDEQCGVMLERIPSQLFWKDVVKPLDSPETKEVDQSYQDNKENSHITLF